MLLHVVSTSEYSDLCFEASESTLELVWSRSETKDGAVKQWTFSCPEWPEQDARVLCRLQETEDWKFWWDFALRLFQENFLHFLSSKCLTFRRIGFRNALKVFHTLAFCWCSFRIAVRSGTSCALEKEAFSLWKTTDPRKHCGVHSIFTYFRQRLEKRQDIFENVSK